MGLRDQRRERFLAQVRETIQHHGMLQPGDRVVVAVSGGADSVALTLALAQLAPEFSLSLFLFHLHHGLRGQAADADARWVRGLAADMGLPCRIRQVNVAELARRDGRGLEAAGRTARYAELAAFAAAVGANRVATGHTRNDQAETVLLRLLRGAGTAGLAGIPPVRPLPSPAPPGCNLIRPLLGVSREETQRFCALAGVTPRVDPSNQDMRFTRNRVRRQLLPALRQFNPGIAQRLAELAEVLRAEESFLEGAAAEWAERWQCQMNEAGAVLPRLALLEAPRALSRRLVRMAAGYLGVVPSFQQVEQVLRQAEAGAGAVHLSRGIEVRVSAREVSMSRRPELRDERPHGAAAAPIPLTVPGVTEVPGLGLALRAQYLDDAHGFLPDSEGIDLDPSLVGSYLAVRTWRPGDRIYPKGMAGSKKLQDLFVDQKVPREQRSRIPLLVTGSAGEVVLWVAGLRADRRFLAAPRGPRLRITLHRA